MKRGALLLSLILALSFLSLVSASLDFRVTDITPSSVNPDEDFTVGIQIQNNEDRYAKNIELEAKYIGEDLQLKESKILPLGELRRNGGIRGIIYHFHTSPEAIDGERTVELVLRWDEEDGYGYISEHNFTINVIAERPKLTISGISSKPERILKEDDLILTLKIENYGEGDAKNVRAYLEDLSFPGTKEAYIGRIETNEEIPARFILKALDAGEYPYKVRLKYEIDGREEEKTMEAKLYVFQKEEQSYYLVIGIAAAILVLLIFVYYRFRKKVKKLEEMKLR